MNDELLPCPFCGTDYIERFDHYGFGGVRHYRNNACPLSDRTYMLDVWNRRAARSEGGPQESKETIMEFDGQSFDARDWAKAFCDRHPEADDGEMIGWFANAIMRGYDEAQRRAKASGPQDAERALLAEWLNHADSGDRIRMACEYYKAKVGDPRPMRAFSKLRALLDRDGAQGGGEANPRLDKEAYHDNRARIARDKGE
jgi:hypothetical protein